MEEEAGKFGSVEGILALKPPATVGAEEGGRCYVRFSSLAECRKAKDVFNGRTFDDRTVKATFASDQEWRQAQAGIWLKRELPTAGPQAPLGLPGLAALPALPM